MIEKSMEKKQASTLAKTTRPSSMGDRLVGDPVENYLPGGGGRINATQLLHLGGKLK
jgi:hypothetical protein